MIRRFTTALLVCLILAGAAQQCSANAVPNPNAFKLATFTDVYMSPSVTNGVLQYTLMLGNAPTIQIGSTTHAINSIQAFFLMASSGSFTADGKDQVGWNWDKKTSGSKATIAGWTGVTYIGHGASKSFSYDTLSLDGATVVPALTVYYQSGSRELNGYYYATSMQSLPVPEPSSLAALGSALAGTMAFLLKRKSVSN